MHELGITESVLNLVVEEGERGHATRITAVNLVIGELASIVPEAVEFYWTFVAEGSIAASARLTWRRVPAEARCWVCDAVYRPAERDFTCPRCGSAEAHLLTGEEFRVESIEID